MLARTLITASLAVLCATTAIAKDKTKVPTQSGSPLVALACTDSGDHVDRFTIDVDEKTVETSRADLTCKLGFVTDDAYKLDC